jgi:hypothetical protein
MPSSAAASNLGSQPLISQTDLRHVFRQRDRNGDGSLSFEEFVADGQQLPTGNSGVAASEADSNPGAGDAPAAGPDAPPFMSDFYASMRELQEMYAELEREIAAIGSYMPNPPAAPDTGNAPADPAPAPASTSDVAAHMIPQIA